MQLICLGCSQVTEIEDNDILIFTCSSCGIHYNLSKVQEGCFTINFNLENEDGKRSIDPVPSV